MGSQLGLIHRRLGQGPRLLDGSGQANRKTRGVRYAARARGWPRLLAWCMPSTKHLHTSNVIESDTRAHARESAGEVIIRYEDGVKSWG